MRNSQESIVPRCKVDRNPSGQLYPRHAVLILDDDVEFLRLVSDEISLIHGARVDTATSATEALRLLVERDYDLVVSDWAVHSSTGPDILRQVDSLLTGVQNRARIEEKMVKVPVMFISGSEKIAQTQVLRLNHFEPISFLHKRCGPEIIGDLARQILDRFQLPRGTLLS